MTALLDERPRTAPTCYCCFEPTPANWRYVGDRAAPTDLCAPHKEMWQGSVDRDERNYEPIP